MDILSEFLHHLRLSSVIYTRPRFLAPWGVRQSPGSSIAFHYLIEGDCCIKLHEEHGYRDLRAGDLVFFPHGTGHELMDKPDRDTLDMVTLFSGCTPKEIAGMTIGGEGAETNLIFGGFNYDNETLRPLLDPLPSMIVISTEGDPALAWVRPAMVSFSKEVQEGTPGIQASICRIVENVFITVLRRQLAEADFDGKSVLAGLQDPQIAQALNAIHRNPQFPWDVKSLGSEAGLSRSSFSARFARLVGEPPLSYLNRWRVRLAAGQLKDKNLRLQEVATSVGYQSEEVLIRNFKRFQGCTPGSYRRQQEEVEVGPT